MQFSKFSGGLFDEEDCWDFLADNMSTFTSSRTTDVTTSPSFSREAIQNFLHDLGNELESLETYQVAYPYLHCVRVYTSCICLPSGSADDCH